MCNNVAVCDNALIGYDIWRTWDENALKGINWDVFLYVRLSGIVPKLGNREKKVNLKNLISDPKILSSVYVNLFLWYEIGWWNLPKFIYSKHFAFLFNS